MPAYECDGCGICCEGHLLVEADILDLLREPRLLEADRYRAGWSLEKALADLEEPGRCLLIAGGVRGCSFLDVKKRCSIYPTRPNDCVGMQAGNEQCQQARQAAGLTLLEPVASPDKT
jgi:Fe-S-cluster containining protein